MCESPRRCSANVLGHSNSPRALRVRERRTLKRPQSEHGTMPTVGLHSGTVTLDSARPISNSNFTTARCSFRAAAGTFFVKAPATCVARILLVTISPSSTSSSIRHVPPRTCRSFLVPRRCGAPIATEALRWTPPANFKLPSLANCAKPRHAPQTLTAAPADEDLGVFLSCAPRLQEVATEQKKPTTRGTVRSSTFCPVRAQMPNTIL